MANETKTRHPHEKSEEVEGKLDYVLAFPQAPVEGELYMKIPKGFELNDGNSDDYVLQLHRNVNGQKQAGRVWNHYLVNKVVNELKFKQSEIDEC
eukprot:scaffold110477_cov55-Attheya_sp.AAC.1